MKSPGGMFLEEIDPQNIDARFFALSQADAVSMDPEQRQLLEVVYEGLENAGISLQQLKSKTYGCFVGSYNSGMRVTQSSFWLRHCNENLLDYSDIQARDPENRSPVLEWTR